MTEDILIKQIDEFKEIAKQLQQQLTLKEKRVQELQRVVEEREQKAEQLQKILQQGQQEAERISQGVEQRTAQISKNLEEQLTFLKTELSEKVHAENVKSYRNMQSLVEELAMKLDTAEEADYRAKSIKRHLRAAIIIGIFNLLAMAGWILYELGILKLLLSLI